MSPASTRKTVSTASLPPTSVYINERRSRAAALSSASPIMAGDEHLPGADADTVADVNIKPEPGSVRSIPRLDAMRLSSLAAVTEHVNRDSSAQFQTWESLTNRKSHSLPTLSHAAKWNTFQAAFLDLVSITKSAYIFGPPNDIPPAVASSFIHELRVNSWVNILRAVAPPPMGDDLTPKCLLESLQLRFQSSAVADSLTLVREFQQFRRGSAESTTVYLQRLGDLHTKFKQLNQAESADDVLDLFFKCAAVIGLNGASSAASSWLTASDAQPFSANLRAAIASDAAAAAQGLAIHPTKTPICHYCKKRGHAENVCRKKKADAKNKESSNGSSASGKPAVHSVGTNESDKSSSCSAVYEFDSGAAIHVSNNRSHFTTFKPLNASASSLFNESASIKGIGDIQLDQPAGGRSLILRNARYCPDAKACVVSVRLLELDGYTLHRNKDPQPIFVARDGLPAANFNRTSNGYFGRFTITPECATSPQLWHQRFGHVNHSYVKASTRHHHQVPQHQCTICLQSKQTRDRGSSHTQASAPFERVFVDLGGGKSALPIGSASTGNGITYYMLLTDDHTRFRWIYFLKTKAEAAENLEDFFKMVKTQFNADIKFLRSDNGREFDNSAVHKLLKSTGTIWEPTAAYAPEQNGVSERGNRTLQDTMRSLLNQSKVPQRFWPYALAAAVHIWNRTSANKPSAFERLYKNPPKIDHFRVFGCIAYAHNPLHKSKLDSRSETFVFLGYSSDNVYLLLNPTTLNVSRRRDVKFIETSFFDWLPSVHSIDDRTLKQANEASSETEPLSYAEAVSSKDSVEWHNAMKQEMDQLHANDTWTLVPKSSMPPNAKILTGRWVYTVKSSGAHKARWVVRGCGENDLSIDDTYAATLPATSVRMLFALAAHNNHFIRQADISSAFLNAPVDRDVFVQEPTGFKTRPGMVCKLNKSLYGLRTAPRKWFETFAATLTKLHFSPLPTDPCLYRRGSVFISVYVDDILLIGPDEQELDSVLRHIKEVFQLTEAGQVSEYLGMQITCDRTAGTITVCQKRKIEKLINDCQLSTANPHKTPLDPGTQLPFPTDVALPNDKCDQYRSFVGQLMHLACTTRPDIMFAVSHLSQCQQTPSQDALNALYHVVRYLKGTPTLGLTFRRDNKLRLSAYSDANWASNQASRATSGVLFLANKTPILWYAKKQTLTARSTCEAEYIAADLAARESVWLQALWSSITRQPNTAIPLSIDNQSAVFLALKQGLQARNRHFLIRHECVREALRDNIITAHHVPGEAQAADGLTKHLSPILHTRFLELMGMSTPNPR